LDVSDNADAYIEVDDVASPFIARALREHAATIASSLYNRPVLRSSLRPKYSSTIAKLETVITLPSGETETAAFVLTRPLVAPSVALTEKLTKEKGAEFADTAAKYLAGLDYDSAVAELESGAWRLPKDALPPSSPAVPSQRRLLLFHIPR
jgi:hypothetical protein